VHDKLQVVENIRSFVWLIANVKLPNDSIRLISHVLKKKINHEEFIITHHEATTRNLDSIITYMEPRLNVWKPPSQKQLN